jgi:acylphosphatase
LSTNKTEYERVHITVTGHVQGVGFRGFVQQFGARLVLTGWVRNVGYDKVETIAEGSRLALEKFVAALRTGPHSARVNEAIVNWEIPTGEFVEFSVRYG